MGYKPKNKPRFIKLFFILVVITIGILCIDYSLKDLWRNWYWNDISLHSALETFGTMAVLLMAIVLLKREQEKNSGNLFFIILGFLSMGIFKGFHAISATPERGFFLLSNEGYLISGFFFALTWLPQSIIDRYTSKKNWVLWGVVISCLLFGAYTLMFREMLPAMFRNEGITATAIWINLLAATFFVIAGTRFLLDFYYSDNLESYLFLYLALCWGLSCLLLRHSLIWSAEWWILQFLGLGAYLLTLGFVIQGYLDKAFRLNTYLAESKITKNLLDESEAKYATLVNQAKDGIIILQDGKIKFANKAMEEITGYTVNELIDNFWLDILISQSRDLATQENQPCCLTNGKGNIACETRIQSKARMIKDIEVSTGLIQYNGKTATLEIVRDVTERKRMEEELQKIQKIESIGVLAGGIAHDFNNILVSIVGSHSLLRLYAKPGDKFLEILDRAEKATSRARDLTRQLLTFSKGGAPIKKATPIFGLIDDTVNFSLRGSKARCEFFIPADLWAVEIDEGQISQVINNLIINAQQAMPKGGIIKICAENITIGAKNNVHLEEGRYVKLTIKDQGIGISKEHLPKIFDPYFTTKEKGCGLGLAISYSIIKKHGGYMMAESEVGVGTTFFIYLPAVMKEIFMVKDIEEEKIRSSKGKILLMDDQQSVREMIGEMLKYIGYEVGFAKEGDEAIELYKKTKESGRGFDAVILDLTVPGGIGGEEVMRKLQEIDIEVKAIVSSGYANDPIMSEYKRYGFRGVVAKPCEIKELSEVLYKVINQLE
ncbi:MAG: PAS domain S-box protein [Thermoplasmata archaeon]|nr:MAG: PAS domain S-box protein [Thermoplasmata archaeon]